MTTIPFLKHSLERNLSVNINDYQPKHVIELTKKELGTLTNQLLSEGATITAYDTVANSTAKQIFGNKITCATSDNNCIKDVDCCIIVQNGTNSTN